MGVARVLLLADTHIGFDQPQRPQVVRRRRGEDFQRNFERALQPALQGKVDIVVHGGDLLFRSKVRLQIVEQALTPLLDVASSGVPVFLVPGNHERSRIPFQLLASHPNLHIFNRPRSWCIQVQSLRVVLSGFPYCRDVRNRFTELLLETSWESRKADVRLLCLHQTVEGATVGPADFMFRKGEDVIRGQDIPGDFCAILSGHIHRHQVLQTDLTGKPLRAPVFYPGSVERTSFAEKEEQKGYLLLTFTRGDTSSGALGQWTFQELPARPMSTVSLDCANLSEAGIRATLTRTLSHLPADSVVQIRFTGPPPPEVLELLTAHRLRDLAPSMNISLRIPGATLDRRGR